MVKQGCFFAPSYWSWCRQGNSWQADMQTVGTFSFLLFQRAIKIVSLCLMIKIAKLMSHSVFIEQTLTYSLSLHKTSAGKVAASEELWVLLLLHFPDLAGGFTCMFFVNEFIREGPDCWSEWICPPLKPPWSCLTCVLDLWVAEIVERNGLRWRAPCSAPSPGWQLEAWPCAGLCRTTPDLPEAALLLQLLLGVCSGSSCFSRAGCTKCVCWEYRG